MCWAAQPTGLGAWQLEKMCAGLCNSLVWERGAAREILQQWAKHVLLGSNGPGVAGKTTNRAGPHTLVIAIRSTAGFSVLEQQSSCAKSAAPCRVLMRGG